MLYLIATPIGNLTDITYRAIQTLQNCDYILCEDTRHSSILLQHYQIHKPLKSYHRFNESAKADSILNDLRAGKQIALISDAGTPGISDPGAALVKLCIDNQIHFTAIPGPCAAIQALSCSGFATDQFQFLGFLPRKQGELKLALQQILSYPGTTICYESPKRLLDVLELIQTIKPDCQLAVARELTKKFEEIIRGTATTLLEYWKNFHPKGEMVLLFAPSSSSTEQDWSHMSPEEHVHFIQETYQLTLKEAIKIVADLRGLHKRALYQVIHQPEN
jgi:16S rRNA (cytidine1402-2'-O)-methyltransferase